MAFVTIVRDGPAQSIWKVPVRRVFRPGVHLRHRVMRMTASGHEVTDLLGADSCLRLYRTDPGQFLPV
ncbi:hypothetical protein CFR78_10920 [Komagataeibacter rhaeticus]|nr:hypothetical protein GLUCORHAEAF1_03530 [Komagataeibacter rhaeticus AF1]PYD53107.1 hypothetical protein CFR78_10920 [Komagataeibacter rhaeticus]